MEPLSALSLFCNIVDICDYTIKVCKECSETYRSMSGRRKHDEELITYIDELQGTLNSLRLSVSKLNRDELHKSILGPVNRMETKLAAALEILNDFQAKKPGNCLSTVIATARVVRRQGKLDRNLRELKQHRDDVHFAIAQITR